MHPPTPPKTNCTHCFSFSLIHGVFLEIKYLQFHSHCCCVPFLFAFMWSWFDSHLYDRLFVQGGAQKCFSKRQNHRCDQIWETGDLLYKFCEVSLKDWSQEEPSVTVCSSLNQHPLAHLCLLSARQRNLAQLFAPSDLNPSGTHALPDCFVLMSHLPAVIFGLISWHWPYMFLNQPVMSQFW